MLRERVLGAMFPLWQRLGIHVTANHFYEPVPDTRQLSDHLWDVPEELPGVDLQESAELELLDRCHAGFADEYDRSPSQPTANPSDYHLENPMFGKVDAEILYCLVRQHRPRRVIEVGSGYSTRVFAGAIAQNRAEDPGYWCNLACVEPYPSPVLRSAALGVNELITGEVQDVPLSRFTDLEANDILFIDSSHVLKIRVLWCSSLVHLRHPDRLATAIPSYRRVGWPSGLPPSSFWMRRIA